MALYKDGNPVSGLNSIPRLTLAQYNALNVKPEFWVRTDAPESYKKLSADQVSYDSNNTVKDKLDQTLSGAMRAEFESTVSGGGDISYSLNNIANNIGVDVSRIVAIIPEGARPKVSWTEVHPVLYFNSTNSTWGIHNFGTGGVAYVDFIVFLRPES